MNRNRKGLPGIEKHSWCYNLDLHFEVQVERAEWQEIESCQEIGHLADP